MVINSREFKRNAIPKVQLQRGLCVIGITYWPRECKLNWSRGEKHWYWCGNFGAWCPSRGSSREGEGTHHLERNLIHDWEEEDFGRLWTMPFLNALTAVVALMTLTDFTLSNARRFYSSMGNPSAVKGLNWRSENKQEFTRRRPWATA